jgi:hypothetical protein
MKFMLPALAAVVLACGCSSGPEIAALDGPPPCRADAPTGSHMVRRSDCSRPAPSDQAQQDIKTLQDLQNNTINLRQN